MISVGVVAEAAQLYLMKKLADKIVDGISSFVGLDARCRGAKEICIDDCTESVLMASGPRDKSGNFFRCMHECMQAAGCE